MRNRVRPRRRHKIKLPRLLLVIAIAAVVIFGIVALPKLVFGRSAQTSAGEAKSYFDFSSYSATEGDLILVNAEHSFPQEYAPAADLVTVSPTDNGKRFTLKSEAASFLPHTYFALDNMLAAAAKENAGEYVITSAYRSVETQQELFDRRLNEQLATGISEAQAEKEVLKSAARPGYSEHHTGLSFDISAIEKGAQVAFEGTRQQIWMGNNCYSYGFVWRYPPNKTDITGIINEPWHFRYVGLPHSIVMRDKNMVLEEYLDYLREQGNISAAADGCFYDIYYVSDSAKGTFELNKKDGDEVAVSGDNCGGYVVTVKRAGAQVSDNAQAERDAA